MRPTVSKQKVQAVDPKVGRGAQIFASKEAQCASCHSGASFTDGITRDVKSKTESDRGSSFETPALRAPTGVGF